VVDALRFVNLVCGALVAGGTFFSIWALRPVIRELPPAEGLDLHQRTSQRVEKYMPLSGLVAGLTAIAILVVDRDLDAVWWITAGGLCLTLLNITVAFTFDLPVTKQLNAMSRTDLDQAEYNRVSDRWDFFHIVRAFFGYGALMLFTIAALLE
jgi:uncharacterized membrane protein